MNIFKRLFGKKPSPTDSQQLLQTLIAFIQADSWNEAQRIVQAHPELLTDEASLLLDQLLEVQESEGARQTIEQHHALLRRCREAGIDVAFAEKTNGSTPVGVPAEVQPLLAELSRPMGIMEMPRRVDLCRQALAQLPRAAHPQIWAALQVELGNSLAQNPQGTRAENLELAIAHYQQALEVRTRQAMPGAWAKTMMNLGVAYADRIRGDRAENLEQAIQHYEQALEVMTRQALPVEWATIMMNLANAYLQRIRGDRAENLERAIQHFHQTLEVRTRQALPAEWATTMMNLATAYLQRIRGDRTENLERAIQHYRQALEVRTRQALPVDWATTMNNLGEAYLQRILGDRAENLERAILSYQQALEVFKLASHPDDHRRVQRNLCQVYFAQEHWPAAQAAARAALKAAEQLYEVAATPEARQAELRESQALPALAVYAASREAPTPTALAQAVVLLEQNRARWLSEALAQSAEKPAAAPEILWQAFTAQRAVIHELEAELRLPEDTPARRDYVTLSQLMTTARQQLAEHVARIREHAPEFMPQPSFAEISAAATITPLVYLVATPAGGLALVVQGESVTPVWLDALTETTLREQLQGPVDNPALGGYLGAYGRWRSNLRDDTALKSWFNALESLMVWLNDTIMQSLIAVLLAQDLNCAVLIPTGWLGLLPLHVAAADMGITFTYAPNARALAAARKIAHDCAPTGLLAIDNPDGSLLFSGAEVAAALESFPAAHRRHLPNAAATPKAVRAALGDYPVWHFSTHGWAGWRKPLESGLLLAGKTALTLRELLGLQAQARLAVLSACETGIPGTELPDEVISLPAGLLQAGVAGVVGSLWAVNDFSTALLMMRFYQAWRSEGQAPPEALHTAQTWLRTSTNADFAAYFKQQLPEFAAERLPEEVASAGYRRFLWKKELTAQPFAHPFYWAGFYYTGV